jgi:dTDP-4-dehydrorhamnose reductase
MQILILGSSGMLGRDLVQEWTEDRVIPANLATDIRDLEQVRRLVTQQLPDWIVLTAACTDVDGGERNPEQAFAVNGEGTKNVARVAAQSFSI